MSARKPWRSGFCNPTNPADSHERCPITMTNRGELLACCCECHVAAVEVLDTPTGYVVTTATPETDAWFSARRKGITGTDLPKILGESKYGNALSVWLDKRGELEDSAGEAAAWGQILEDPVAQEWARRNETSVIPVGVLAHVEASWMRASLDRIVIDCPDDDGVHRGCGLEIKTRSAFVSDAWDDGMPDSVLAQVAWGRLVSGLDHMHVAALIGGQRLVTFRYDRDDVLEQYLVDHARPVWEAVEQGIPPVVDADGEGVLLALLDQLYRSHDGDRDIDPSKAEELLAKYADGGELEKKGKALKTSAKTELIQLLGDGAVGCIDGVPAFTYKPDPSGYTVAAADLKAFRETEPEQFVALVEAGLITTTNPRPTFRVKPKKKEKAA